MPHHAVRIELRRKQVSLKLGTELRVPISHESGGGDPAQVDQGGHQITCFGEAAVQFPVWEDPSFDAVKDCISPGFWISPEEVGGGERLALIRKRDLHRVIHATCA